MNFTQTPFLGASISQFSASAGWNSQASSLNVTLAEDSRVGDSFLPKSADWTGKPSYFQFSNFKFGGIVQRWLENNSSQGKPLYEVTLIAPNELLDAAVVVLDKFYYSGQAQAALFRQQYPNIFNVFDLWERSGFGNAKVNESGMPLGLIILGIIELQSVYNKPIKFRGVNYYIDFTSIFNLSFPEYYRVGGDAISILELISTICEDFGCDFLTYLELVNGLNMIKFKLVSRRTQPVLNKIAQYISSKSDVSVNSKGQEARQETTTVVIVGGEVNVLQLINTGGESDIWPYWGTDVEGNLIIGENTGNEHTFFMNSAPVFDILGDVRYECNVLELRCALANIESWTAYIKANKPEVADKLELIDDVDFSKISEVAEKIIFTKLENDKPSNFGRGAQRFQEELEDRIPASTRMYDLVSSYAKDYYGKQFLIRLPDVKRKYIQEEDRYVFDYNISDGGFLPEGSAPLGLLEFNSDVFQLEDGRYASFVRFNLDNIENWDLSDLPEDSYIIQDDFSVFVKCEVDSNFYFSSNLFGEDTLCIITLPGIIKQKAKDDMFGDYSIIGEVIGEVTGVEPDVFRTAKSQNAMVNTLNFTIYPRLIGPDVAAIPLKSNARRYGPWGASLDNGKVRLEIDDSLVPWNYGGYTAMSQAIEAKVANSVTGMVVGETGSVTQAGAPEISLGDTLVAGGPNVTDISVSVGSDGVTTQYSMRTFTPKFGAFARSNAERLRRLALANQKRDRAMKQLARKIRQQRSAASRAASEFLSKTYTGAKPQRKSPHNVILCRSFDDGSGETNNNLVATHESVNLKFTVDINKVQEYGMIGMEGLFRPFSTQPGVSDLFMPHFVSPQYTGVLNVNSLNPFASGTDIVFTLRGNDEYQGYINNGESDNLRAVGFKGPLIINGWGYNIWNKPVPNKDDNDLGNEFEEGYLAKPYMWKAGPLFTNWSETLGMWFANTFKKLEITVPISSPGDIGSGCIIKYKKTAADKIERFPNATLGVTNFLRGGSLTTGQRVYTMTDPDSGYEVVISAEC